MPRCPTLVIAGTHSGSGKTSFALALAHALTRRGLAVQTFKVALISLTRPTSHSLPDGPATTSTAGWPEGSTSAVSLKGP